MRGIHNAKHIRYQDALDGTAAMGARPMSAEIELDFASLLARRGEAQQAQRLIASALEASVDLSLDGLGARANALLE
jgi:hypothetical protein